MLSKTQIEMFLDDEDAKDHVVELAETAEQLIKWLEPLVMPQSLFGMDAIDKARKEAREYFLEEWE